VQKYKNSFISTIMCYAVVAITKLKWTTAVLLSYNTVYLQVLCCSVIQYKEIKHILLMKRSFFFVNTILLFNIYMMRHIVDCLQLE
jgi:hypothetical protein